MSTTSCYFTSKFKLRLLANHCDNFDKLRQIIWCTLFITTLIRGGACHIRVSHRVSYDLHLFCSTMCNSFPFIFRFECKIDKCIFFFHGSHIYIRNHHTTVVNTLQNVPQKMRKPREQLWQASCSNKVLVFKTSEIVILIMTHLCRGHVINVRLPKHTS